MPKRVFSAVVHREGPWYVADCPEIGTVSQGATMDEAIANLREATELFLEEFSAPDTSAPVLTTFEAAFG